MRSRNDEAEPPGDVPAAAATFDKAVAVEDGMDGTDARQVRYRGSLAEFLADLGRAPARIFAFEADDHRLDRRGQAVRLAEGPAAPVGEGSRPQSL